MKSIPTMPRALVLGVCYADIFDYPLNARELTLWGVGAGTAKYRVFPDGYYFLHGRSSLVAVRRRRAGYAREKWAIARQVAGWLRLVPTIGLVGVTGGLAMDNAKREDDIDLFFVTAPGTLWVTRLMAICIVELMGRRRRPRERAVYNKVCLNMFMTADSVAIPAGERDLFAAHEVLQMVPVIDRAGAYGRFLRANSWVKQFLPNAWEEKRRGTRDGEQGRVFFLSHVSCLMLRFFEPVARWVQLTYMKKHRTTEVVTDTVLRFHPRDARVWIRKELGKRLRRYNIPLDNVFYGS